MKRLLLTILMVLFAAPAIAEERADPLMQSVVQSISTTASTAQLLLDAYRRQHAEIAAQRARLEWFDAYFRNLAPESGKVPE